MTELELKIKDAAQKYYTDGSSPLTDAEFDALVDELKKTNPDSELLKTGWGYDVSEDSTPGKKVKHKYGRAGSLEKCHNWKELGYEFQNSTVDISLKLDGISCVLYYEHGKFVQALTRGDGITGIDITDKVRRIFPVDIKSSKYNTFTGAVRGELLMTYPKFEEFSEIHSDAKNPRNSTAGVINSKEITSDIDYISLVVYTIVGLEYRIIDHERTIYGANMDIFTVRQALEDMFGVENVVPHKCVELLNSDVFMNQMNSAREEWYNMFPADGIVITKLFVDLHVTSELTYNACAFKFPAESKDCEVEDVVWNMSKTRYAIPTIKIKTTQLSGTDVTYCTGFNAKWICDNGIGHGAIITVCKSGEIIPTVLKVVKQVRPQLIEFCPVCEHRLEWYGVHLKCPNDSCGNAITQDTLVWLKNLVPMDGLGDTLKIKFLEELVASGELADISIESIMETKLVLREDTDSVQFNLFAKMWNTLHGFHEFKVDLVDALVSLNIPRLSHITASKLANYPLAIQSVMNKAIHKEYLDPYDLISLNAIGNANAKSIEDNLWKMARLKYVWTWVYNRLSVPSASESKGKVAITGKLSVKRSDFEKELRSIGFTPADICRESVYLITDNPNSSSSKNKKADSWGIKKITEAEFRALYL